MDIADTTVNASHIHWQTRYYCIGAIIVVKSSPGREAGTQRLQLTITAIAISVFPASFSF